MCCKLLAQPRCEMEPSISLLIINIKTLRNATSEGKRKKTKLNLIPELVVNTYKVSWHDKIVIFCSKKSSY